MYSFYVKENTLYFYENREFIENFDISSQDKLNETFQNICIYDNLNCVKYLLSLKANIDYNDGAPLIQSILGYDGDLSIIKFLLENKASANSNDNEPLITVCDIQNCDIDLIKLLVENNADVTSQNNKALRITSSIYDRWYIWYEEPGYEDLKIRSKVLEYLVENGADKKCMSFHAEEYMLRNKYFTKWRKIVFRNFIRKVITPLYYSPGFPGGERKAKEFEKVLNLLPVPPQNKSLQEKTSSYSSWEDYVMSKTEYDETDIRPHLDEKEIAAIISKVYSQ